MRISEIFLLENLSINVPYHRLTMTIVCLNLSRFQYFDRKGNTLKCVFGQVKTAPNLPDGASENYSVICSIPEEQND
jgi:hypothetical protein